VSTNPTARDESLLDDSPPEYARGLAELAFGSFTQNVDMTQARHLALLPAESLELDLNDPAQRQFGDYELLELLGEGGMGVVYRARQVPLDREVAVKLLSAGPWASREFIARFEREAQNAARMQHPAIVTIYEVGSFEGMQFFSMRLVRGESLSARLKRGEKFTPREAAALMRTIAEAVGYAHSLGVLHLDLKPANVLLDETGQPYVADFGLARRLENALAVDNDEVSGTPSYMAPEQAQVRAHKLTAATDIWGLGAILYELLTGRPPFRAETAQDTVNLVLEGQVRAPRRLRSGLPLDLQAIVMHCLSRNPAERYPTARALADDLARFVEGRPVQARPLNGMQRVVRWTRREPRLAATLACAVAALVIGLVATTYQWRHARKNAVLAQNNADLARHTLWKSRSDVAQEQMQKGEAYPALANVVANLREMEAHGDRSDAALERLRIGTVLANAPQLIDVIPVSMGVQITALAISPDGKSVAVVTGGRTVHMIDVASGRQRWQVKVAPNSFGMTVFGANQATLELHFSADGRRLIGYAISGAASSGVNPELYPHDMDSVLIDAVAGELVEPPKSFGDFLATDYSEDGRYALLFDKHGDVQRWRTLPWSADGDRVHLDGLVAASPDGVQVQGEALLTDGGVTMVLADRAKLEFRSFDATHMRLQQTLHLTREQDRATAWAVRHDGRQLAIGTNSGQLAVWNLGTGKATWLHLRFDGWLERLSFSPDNSRLLAVSSEPSEMRVFDARSLELVATPVMLGNGLDPSSPADADFGPDASTILTRHWASTAVVWRVPERGYPLQAPIAAAPPMVGKYARFALATDARSHLMATADNGQLKLWRVRWTPFVGGTAAPMVSDTLRFDGHHLVSADGNRVSVFNVATGQTDGKTIALSEAPTYAGLDGSGTHLIAIAGRELSCWNWRDGKPCWPVIILPDSPLRLGFAARTPILAVSTGSNEDGKFFESVRLIDLATGRQRGAPITLRAPLGALRLSDDGRRLLIFEDRNIFSVDSNVLRVVDTRQAKIIQSLVHTDKSQAHLDDARFADDGSIWSLSGPTGWGDGPDPKVWHWGANGKPIGKPVALNDEVGLLPLPQGRGVIEMATATMIGNAVAKTLSAVPDVKNRVDVGAISPDGKLLAIGVLDGVGLFIIDRNQRLVPDFKLALPNHDIVQQLAFAPDGSRLIGRTITGRWFQWRIVADTRSVGEIEQDLRLRDFTDQGLNDRGKSAPPLSAEQRRKLRAADPGPAPEAFATTPVNARVAAPVPDPRYEPLDLDAISNVDPRTPMNRAARVPRRPQMLPTLPRGLQRYDGVDFLLGRAVQLAGSPLNLLNTSFPAKTPPLRIAPQRIAAIDALVFQFDPVAGEIGAVRLRYSEGGEQVLTILDKRDTRALLDIRPTGTSGRRVGWLGNFATALRGFGLAIMGETTIVPSYVVRLQNPEPDRPVVGISLEAPSNANPGLLFLGLTLEPSEPHPVAGKTSP
jgi:WD40 repeat protein